MAKLVLSPFLNVLDFDKHSYDLTIHCIDQGRNEFTVTLACFEFLDEFFGLFFEIIDSLVFKLSKDLGEQFNGSEPHDVIINILEGAR